MVVFSKKGMLLSLKGEHSAKDVAGFLVKYCQRHAAVSDVEDEPVVLYRIFYYDCMPSSKIIFNPLTGKVKRLGKTEQYKWMNDFFSRIKTEEKSSY